MKSEGKKKFLKIEINDSNDSKCISFGGITTD